MPLQATSGAASYDAFGGGVAAVPTYIEDVFSTYLYKGNASTQTITNGIDLAGKGGLVWTKSRTNANEALIYDTVRGVNNYIIPSSTQEAQTSSGTLTAFNSNGFTLGANDNSNDSSTENSVSWSIAKAPKFFDIVTYTGNGTGGTQISHSLGSTPGCIIVKSTSTSAVWTIFHQSLSQGLTGSRLLFDTSAATNGLAGANIQAADATTVTLGSVGTNNSGTSYVMYLFAHNAGGFGLTGTDNVISCGSYVVSGGSATINLGYEPQFVLTKASSATGNWLLLDNMRQFDTGGATFLSANTTAAETGYSVSRKLTNTGFTLSGATDGTYIYIAIRRGPMKVPTSGTSVFAPVAATPSGATTVTTNFPVDLAINAQRDAGTSGNKVFWDRLRGSSTAAGQGIFSNLTNAEVSYSGNGIGLQSNTTIVDNFWNTLNGATTPVIYWNFRRAPSFFDEVCYTGNGTTNNVSHNLGVVPELMIVKGRTVAFGWATYSAALGVGNYLVLNTTAASAADPGNVLWNNTAPTSNIFTVGPNSTVNKAADTYVAYLFATCAGVSKCGTFTGNGSSQTINCGFTGGARFVMIKATSTTGDWMVADSARGIVSGNDPYLELNNTNAEVTGEDWLDTDSTGFVVNEVSGSNANTNGVTYIYLAIA